MQQQRVQIPMGVIIILLVAILIVWMVGVTVAVVRRPPLAANQVKIGDQIITLAVNRNDRAEIIGDPVAVQAEPAEATPEPAEPVAEPVEVQVEEAPEEPTAVPDTQGEGGIPVNTEKYLYSQHSVRQTDTLYSLAQEFNTTIPLLARFGTSTLIPGQSVTITQANPAYCAPNISYIVHEGETPGSIAAAYGTTVEALSALNGAQGTLAVYETDVICVPAG